MDKVQTIHGGRKIQIIGVASGGGAKDERCADGPLALRDYGLVSHLQARHTGVAWNDTIHAGTRAGDVVAAVSGVCTRLAQHVKACVGRGDMPVVLGGDHSCAIGTWKGAAQALRGPLGLIWIDAHMDAHTPLSTPSGALHGMPLACLLGYGDQRLTAIGGGITLQPQHVCLIGVRSFETGEAALLRRLGVRIYFMPEVARRGLSAVLHEALTIVTSGCAGFGITLDLDALDPHDAPGVGSPVAGGLRGAELAAALPRIATHPALTAIEIAEYNPERDRDCRTARLVTQLLDAMLYGLQAARDSETPIELGRFGVKIDHELVHDR
jgi:arginase